LLVADAAAQTLSSAVRVLHPALTETLRATAASSPHFQNLLAELDRSDLIIHVAGMPSCHHAHLAGALYFVEQAGGHRFVRITINTRLTPPQRAAALAHELHHAAEVARSPWVDDLASFARLYRQIGRPSRAVPATECYETDDTLRAGEMVLAEIEAAERRANHARRSATAASAAARRRLTNPE
jgi:hypothetical protein